MDVIFLYTDPLVITYKHLDLIPVSNVSSLDSGPNFSQIIKKGYISVIRNFKKGVISILFETDDFRY